jgi:hypothetical protein
MALSILASIVPFLFIARKKAFLFCSVMSLLMMCMTYQAASGIYILVVIIFCFQDWNSRVKANKEIFSFIGLSAFAFCLSMMIFKLFFVRTFDDYASTNTMTSLTQIVTEVPTNIKSYFLIINQDFGLVWKIVIAIVFLFFIIKSVCKSSQRKIISFLVSLLFICIAFISSYGVYYLLEKPLFLPRALYGIGAFLAILCIYVVDFKKAATVTAIALSWCFLVFAFSYGNALADQNRYANFRINLLLHDLSTLYPNRNTEDMPIQINNSIGHTPIIHNIAKHYPVIKRLVPLQVEGDDMFTHIYILRYFNWGLLRMQDFSTQETFIDYRKYDLPVVLDSYYHTIKSDGDRVLIILSR